MAEGNPMTRYARQMILPQVGPSGQETLAFCIASRCVTACFVSRVSLFRIFRTWSNQ